LLKIKNYSAAIANQSTVCPVNLTRPNTDDTMQVSN